MVRVSEMALVEASEMTLEDFPTTPVVEVSAKLAEATSVVEVCANLHELELDTIVL